MTQDPRGFSCTDDSPLNTGSYYLDEVPYPYNFKKDMRGGNENIADKEELEDIIIDEGIPNENGEELWD